MKKLMVQWLRFDAMMYVYDLNHIDLPPYPSYQGPREKLTWAIDEASGFGQE